MAKDTESKAKGKAEMRMPPKMRAEMERKDARKDKK